MEAFDQFVQERKEDLRRIARHTRRECTFGDIVNEAWLMAGTVSVRQQPAWLPQGSRRPGNAAPAGSAAMLRSA